MVAVGIDACKSGWIAVVLRPGAPPRAHFLADIDALRNEVPDATGIGIDIPIGLLETGWREADLAARGVLKHRRSSIFVTPVRAALEATTHAAASALSVEHSGSGISQQAFALRTKILQVDRWLAEAPCPVWEVHPEVSFTELMGHPASATKKSWQGMVERRDALRDAGIDLEAIDPAVGRLTGVDDLLDAAVAAWSTQRLLAGEARSFPDPPQPGPDGRPIAIWA